MREALRALHHITLALRMNGASEAPCPSRSADQKTACRTNQHLRAPGLTSLEKDGAGDGKTVENYPQQHTPWWKQDAGVSHSQGRAAAPFTEGHDLSRVTGNSGLTHYPCSGFRLLAIRHAIHRVAGNRPNRNSWSRNVEPLGESRFVDPADCSAALLLLRHEGPKANGQSGSEEPFGEQTRSPAHAGQNKSGFVVRPFLFSKEKDMLNISEDDLKKAIVQKASDEILRQDDDLTSMIREEVKARLDKIFVDRAQAQVSAAIDDAIRDGFEREYQRVNPWGTPEGEKTSIRKELDKVVTGYWSARVNTRTGKPENSDYNTVTRAEYLMTQICAEDFSKGMKDAVIAVTGGLKDGLRKQLATHMDGMLDGLFHIRSLQDQGKVEKPW